MLPLLILPVKLVSSLAIPNPYSLMLLLLLLDGDMNAVRCNAFPALRVGDFIPPIGVAVTDRLERRFRRRGRSDWRNAFKVDDCDTALDGCNCDSAGVGVGVRLRSIGSPGVDDIIMGDEGGSGVYALDISMSMTWAGASRPEAKKLEYVLIVGVVLEDPVVV